MEESQTTRDLMDIDISGRQKLDFFSELPKHLIHNIMSLGLARDSNRMSVLSTSFRSAFRSLPIFDFDDQSINAPRMWIDDFFSYVQNSINNSQLDSNFIWIFSLKIDFTHLWYSSNVNDYQVNETIGDFVDFVMINRVRELVLEFRNKANIRVPISVFLCASIRTMRLLGLELQSMEGFVLTCPLLEVLTIESCSLLGNFILSSPSLKTVEFENCSHLESIRIEDSAASLESFSFRKSKFLHHNRYNTSLIGLAKCRSLRYLHLECDFETEEVNCVDSLEAIEVRNCLNLTGTVCLKNLNLRSVDFEYCPNVKEVVILCENLECFRFWHERLWYWDNNISKTVECRINIDGCKRLKELIVCGVNGNLTDEWIKKGFERRGGLRFLESLELQCCNLLQELRFSSENLKKLQLDLCEGLRLAEIEAYNLEFFEYGGDGLHFPSLIFDSPRLHAHLFLVFEEHQMAKLRNFLSFFGHCQSLTLTCKSEKLKGLFSKGQRSDLVSPMYDLKHLTLKLVGIGRYYDPINLIDNILWLAPKLHGLTIYMASKLCAVLKLYYNPRCLSNMNELLCCNLLAIKCWRHCLERVEVEVFDDFDLEKRDLQRLFMNKAILKRSILEQQDSP